LLSAASVRQKNFTGQKIYSVAKKTQRRYKANRWENPDDIIAPAGCCKGIFVLKISPSELACNLGKGGHSGHRPGVNAWQHFFYQRPILSWVCFNPQPDDDRAYTKRGGQRS